MPSLCRARELVPLQSVLSGLCASLASVAAKLACDFSPTSPIVTILDNSSYGGSAALLWAVRIALLLCVVGLNGIMIKFWVQAMTQMTAVQATVLNFGLNHIFSGFFGYFLLGETKVVSLRWFGGMCLMGLGVGCVAVGRKETMNKKDRED